MLQPTISTNQEGFTAGSHEYAPGDVYQLKRMDENEMQRRPCRTCNKKKEQKSKRGRAVITTYQAGPVVVSKTLDMSMGQMYTGAGFAWPPGAGISQEMCVVQPFGDNAPADVITGPSAGAMYTGEIAGPSGAVYGNASGLMFCGGVTSGVSGGVAVSGTVTPSWTGRPF